MQATVLLTLVGYSFQLVLVTSLRAEKRDLRSLNIFDQLTDPAIYDFREPPESDGPIEIMTSVSMILTGIQSQSSEFSSQLVIQHVWLDNRLSFSQFGPGHPSTLKGEGAFSQKIWKPSIYVVNEKESSVIDVPQENVLVKIQPNGTVTFSYRLRSGVYCALNLMKFPFDEQLCSIFLESWSLTVDELILLWNTERGIQISNKFPMLEYSLVSHSNRARTNQRYDGEYSSLVLEFLLRRDSGYYIIDFYVPAMFLVILSWVSFWLEAGAVPARVTIGTSTMLTFITLSRNLSAALPKVSYIKAVDVYAIMCICFIFASLIEFAFVNSIWRRSREMELQKLSTSHVIRRALTPSISRRASVCLSVNSNEKSDYFSELNQYTIQSDDPTETRERSFTSQLRLQVRDILHQRKPNLVSQSCPNLSDKDTEAIQDDNNCESITIPVPTVTTPKQKKPAKKMNPHDIAKYIDRRSRIFFPVLFLVTNILYWSLVWI